jgi:hypothetical protein
MLVWKLLGKVLETVLWRIDPLLGEHSETNETKAVTRQRPALNNGRTARSEAISRNRPSSVQLVQCREVKSWLVSKLVRELQFSPCELLLLEAGS